MSDDRSSAGDIEAKRKAASYVGQVVGGRYRVDGIVALGGMGAVFRAEHVHLRKQVALKLLHPSMHALPELVTRFERESIVGAHVSHPNVCQATDFGQLEDGAHYLVLEYVEGRTLHDVLKDGRIDPLRAARIAAQIAAGLGAAHRLGFVHRDVKPANVMLAGGRIGGDPRTPGPAGAPDEEPSVKIVDFGLAKLPAGRFRIDEKINVTAAGSVFGTVAYMAPELARGMIAVDRRSDLYALGVILYEMLGGKHPFDAVEPSALFRQHVKQPPPPLSERAPEAAVPPELEAVARKLLEKDPAARYQSAEELREALEDAVPEAGIAPDPIPRPAPSNPRSSPSTRTEAIEIAQPSDASPPPAPAVPSEAVARPPARRSPIRALLLAVVVLGGAAAASQLSVARSPQAGPAAATPPSSPATGPSASPSTSAAATASAATTAGGATKPSSGAASAASPPSPAVSLSSPEVVRLRGTMNEATAAHDARRSSGALIALAKAAPDAFRDRDLVSEAAAVTVAAALDPSLADDVFALLSGPALGEGGPDVLFHVASFYGGSRGASRAALLLANPEVLARASPALRVTRDFKALACKLRPSLFDRAAAEGDERTLALLTAMLAAECDETSGACCAPHDPQLAAATSRLRQRLHK